MNQDLVSYYNDRAKEYEKVYLNPAEQGDLLKATTIFQTLFSKKTVLEIACGTGYWTKRIAESATSIHATDINKSVVDIAQTKPMPSNVTFGIADMYRCTPDEKYEGLFAGFIWSHIPLQDLDEFINRVKSFLKPGGAIGLIDSNQVAGTNHDVKRITKTDEHGNTFQTRELENGDTHLVLKNFPTKDFLFQKLSRIATDISFINLEHYWVATCTLAKVRGGE